MANSFVICMLCYIIFILFKVGLKAAGGLKTANDALTWLVLIYQELGPDWLNAGLFRIGASSLLASIENRIYQLAFEKNELDHTQFLLG